MSMDKLLNDKVLQITSGGGYVYDGPKAEGFHIIHPYKSADNLLKRILRELCFRVPFLPKVIWYNKEIYQYHPEYIIISDSLTTRHYLKWLHKLFPQAQINFVYHNLIGKARHILPKQIPSGIRKWVFDEKTGEQYAMRVFKNSPYPLSYLKPKVEPKYDVFYVGADKGRGERLLQLEENLKSLGLKTKFIITADGRFSRKKTYYQNPISYDQTTTYLTQSRAVLNVALEGQHGMTLRDKEALFFDIKLISTNIHIKEKDLYTENNVFVLTESNWKEIPAFLDGPKDNLDYLKEKYTYTSFVNEIISE